VVPPTAPVALSLDVTNWSAVVAQLKLGGLVRELANNSIIEEASGDALKLVLNAAHASLLNRERETALAEALAQHLGHPVRISIRVGELTGETPAQERRRQQDERQQAAVAAIEQDPNVEALKQAFGARVNPASIRPK
jgi:DNA polymerase-3 subunit gamma/tau